MMGALALAVRSHCCMWAHAGALHAGAHAWDPFPGASWPRRPRLAPSLHFFLFCSGCASVVQNRYWQGRYEGGHGTEWKGDWPWEGD